ncbi:MAG TPA: 5'/3'-nucleotidase SurE [Phycisphaerales bacterium]|nr:5'/3'-nucleotidase SurE [Phycisphaerales bacterium]
MRILLTNDDGIRAPGIIALHDALMHDTPQYPGALGGPKSQCLVVAPLTVQSATSHGITFHEPLMVREERLRGTGSAPSASGVAVDGRPADCVKLAVSSIWPARMQGKPDVVISGMNAGANCGINVIYSGTVAAAIEGAFLGIPSIAVSLRLGRGKPRFDLAAHRARHVLEQIFRKGDLEAGEILSINIPTTEEAWADGEQPKVDRIELASHHSKPQLTNVVPPPTTMPAIHVCPMNVHGLIDKYEQRMSPLGDTYYWAAGHGLDFHATEEGSDVDLLMKHQITVTPLKFDLTRHDRMQKWRGVLG